MFTAKRRAHPQIRSSFFNFGKNILDPNLLNPCDTPVLRKIFAHPKPKQWTILDKDVVDGMIFRTENPRNRLILELMARSGMRMGEVLSLRADWWALKSEPYQSNPCMQ